MSLNIHGVDRKLNVALTRAKEQIILVGNKNTLMSSTLYAKLIEEYEEIDWKFMENALV
jgi:DNA replication ATP-dependent helicase Dna2